MFIRKKNDKATKSLQARIIVSKLSYNNSVMVVDENGESHKEAIPDPVVEEVLVEQGDQVDGFEVISVLKNFIELKSFLEHTTVGESKPGTHFVIEKGESLELRMYDLRDAVETVSIKYVEPVE